MTEQFMPKKTDLDKLNELIDWYEKNKPQAGKVIQVKLPPEKVAKMIGHDFKLDAKGNPIVEKILPYRGRALECV